MAGMLTRCRLKVVCSPWMAMRVLGMEFGYEIPVMPIGGKYLTQHTHEQDSDTDD
jgi:hypothetical protein